MVIRTGLARKPWTNYKTSNHIIAYLDILGAKDMICNDNNFDFLNHLNMFMEDAIEEAGGGIFPKGEDIYIKIFSDNILLAIELKEDDEQREHKIAILFNAVANTSIAGFCVASSTFLKASYKIVWATPLLPSSIILLINLVTNFELYIGSGNTSLFATLPLRGILNYLLNY